MASTTAGTPAAATDALVQALEHHQLVAYFDAVSATLFLFDFFLTFSLEIEFIWNSRWTVVKVLYIVQRYLPFFDTVGLVLYHQFATVPSVSYCSVNYIISGWGFAIGTAISETILAIRLWAIWNNSFSVRLGLWMFYASCWIPDFVFMGIFLRSLRFKQPLSIDAPHFGCFIAAGSRILLACWALLMIFDTGSLLLILIPGISVYRSGGMPELTRTVYREGMIYYVYLFGLSLLNILIILHLTPDLINLLASFERVIHSVLTSRVLLHIRKVASQESECMESALVHFNSLFGLNPIE